MPPCSHYPCQHGARREVPAAQRCATWSMGERGLGAAEGRPEQHPGTARHEMLGKHSGCHHFQLANTTVVVTRLEQWN